MAVLTITFNITISLGRALGEACEGQVPGPERLIVRFDPREMTLHICGAHSAPHPCGIGSQQAFDWQPRDPAAVL